MPLTAGTRICLTYSVFSTGSIRLETATSLFHDARDFECEIGKWNRLRKSEDVPNLLAYVLEDRYSDEVLEFASLTAVDRLKAKFLRERCEQSGVRPFLSKMTGTKTLGYTYRPDESTMELNDLVDFDGKDVLDATVGIEAGSIVQKDIYNGRESDDPDQDYYPGEEFEEREGESYVDFVRLSALKPTSNSQSHGVTGFRTHPRGFLFGIHRCQHQRRCSSNVDRAASQNFKL